MARIIGGLGVLLILFAHWAQAQTPAPVDDTPLPDPSALASDWWNYFENAGDQISERIALFTARLELNQEIDLSSGATEIQDAVDEIEQSFDIYVELKNRQPLASVESPVVAKHYTLPQILDLVGNTRDLQLETDLEREEIIHRDAEIKRVRKRLDNLRVVYFALDKQDPLRVTQGLTIIRDRLRMVVAQEELRLLRPQLEHKEQYVKALRSIFAAAADRLIASDDDLKSYERLYELASAEVSRLIDEAAFHRLRGAGVVETPIDHANARRNRHRLVQFDVRIASAELARSQALVAVAFTSHLNPETRNADKTNLRDALNELHQALKETEKSRQTWRRATDNERSTAEAQLSLTQSQNAGLAEIHRARIRQTDNTLQGLAELRENLAKGQALADLASRRVAAEEGWLVARFVNLRQDLSEFWTTLTQLAVGSLFTINETPVTLLGLFRILVILAVAWWVSKLVRHGLDRIAQRREAMNRASLYTVGRLFHYTILTIGIFVGLSSIGLDFTKLALFVSALGVGLGFGLQAIFSNFVAGLIILFERSLKVGDFVELESGVNGEVREINIRSTLVTTNDNIDILVPNSEFVGGRVTNWTLREVYRRARIPFGVAYGTDKELVKKAGLEAATIVPFTLTGYAQREPQVWLVGFGDSSLNFELVVWLVPDAVSRPGTVHATYTWEIETALKKYGIEIPFPQRDLHLRSDFREPTSNLSPAADDDSNDPGDHILKKSES
ncbi:MAG: mechanosensitive ion channel [Gammaproteobacteria bacterium]|nr:mechanosensitive ion channel [Gammaproteobacteria bacterium]